jgi:hypothetical protein
MVEAVVDLRQLRRFHEEEAGRLRQQSQSLMREAEEHEQWCKAYDLVLSDPALSSNGTGLGTAAPDSPAEGPSEPVTAAGGEEDANNEATLIEMVRKVLTERPPGRFTVADVSAELDPAVLAKAETRAVTKVLWRLAQRKEIRQLRPGHGPRPAVYTNRN